MSEKYFNYNLICISVNCTQPYDRLDASLIAYRVLGTHIACISMYQVTISNRLYFVHDVSLVLNSGKRNKHKERKKETHEKHQK